MKKKVRSKAIRMLIDESPKYSLPEIRAAIRAIEREWEEGHKAAGDVESAPDGDSTSEAAPNTASETPTSLEEYEVEPEATASPLGKSSLRKYRVNMANKSQPFP